MLAQSSDAGPNDKEPGVKIPRNAREAAEIVRRIMADRAAAAAERSKRWEAEAAERRKRIPETVNLDDVESLLGDLELDEGTVVEALNEDALYDVEPTVAPAPVSTKVTDAEPAPTSTKVTEPAPKPISRKVTAPRRGSKTADDNSIEVIRWLERNREHGAEGPTSVAPLPSASALSPSSSSLPAWTLPAWEHLGPRAKSYLLHIATNRLGGRAVTVRFGLPGLARAMAEGKRGKRFMTRVKKDIDRALERRLGRKVLSHFTVEARRPNEVPHLHGGACVTANEEAIADAAIKEAVTPWTHRRGAKHQIVWDDRADDDNGRGAYANWGTYCCKGMGSTAKRIPGTLIAVSGEITRTAKAILAGYKAQERSFRKAMKTSKAAKISKPAPAVYHESMFMAAALDSTSTTTSTRSSTPSPTSTPRPRHLAQATETAASESTPISTVRQRSTPCDAQAPRAARLRACPRRDLRDVRQLHVASATCANSTWPLRRAPTPNASRQPVDRDERPAAVAKRLFADRRAEMKCVARAAATSFGPAIDIEPFPTRPPRGISRPEDAIS